MDKLYKGEMCSLFFLFYGQYIDEDKTKKPELVKILGEKIQENHLVLQHSDLDLSELCSPTAEPRTSEGQPYSYIYGQ
jgi:hypothetical protein